MYIKPSRPFKNQTKVDHPNTGHVRYSDGYCIYHNLEKYLNLDTVKTSCSFQIKKAVSIRKHLERNRKDRDAKFRLILIESRIHRLARYYKTRAVLPPNWKYESSTASALVS